MTRRTPEPWLLVAEKPGGAGDGHTHLTETRAMRRGFSGLESLLSSILLVWLPGQPSCHRAPGCPIGHQLPLACAVPSHTTLCSWLVPSALCLPPSPRTSATLSRLLYSLFSPLKSHILTLSLMCKCALCAPPYPLSRLPFHLPNVLGVFLDDPKERHPKL